MSNYSLLTYKTEAGARAGFAIGGAVYDLATISANLAYATVRGVIEDWPRASLALDKLATTALTNAKPLKDVALLAPLPNPGTIYCAGANYSDHVANMARMMKIAPEPDPHEVGLDPWHFIKSASCVVGPDASIELTSTKLDWEVELAMVIGRTAKRVPLDRALDYVAFYTVANDLSARDRTQRDKVNPTSPFRYDWIGQKNFDGACPMGPWLVPAAAIGDPQTLALKTWVNEKLKQDSNTSRMIFTCAEQLAHLSSRITLHPGDVILTGTPAGVGAESAEFLAKGDVVRVSIEKIGEFSNRIGQS